MVLVKWTMHMMASCGATAGRRIQAFAAAAANR
jgi:hypothetical protein